MTANDSEQKARTHMPTPEQQQLLRKLPQVEEALHHPAIEALLNIFPRGIVVDQTREGIGDVRKQILSGLEAEVELDAVATVILKRFVRLEKPSLRRVVNASGVIVHTNLGRSPLADTAVAAVNDVARGYSTLEYNVREMKRGSRHDHYESLICAITGAEAAIAVNNNAAAVMMVLREFAYGHETVISRGELVEIGGSFRVPDIMETSGAIMVEVGTTNKTHPFDYERAIGDNTAMLLKVHPSNYRLTGFVEDVPVKELRALADAANAHRSDAAPDVLVYEDLGSGALVDIQAAALRETTVSEAIAEGADLVSFSCDKLLGGPQAGIVVGTAQAIDRLKKNPLARVLRLDKLTIAALEATLRLYLDENDARKRIPTLSMLSASPEDVSVRAHVLADALRTKLSPDDATTSVESEVSRAGGGALPMCDIPTTVVSLDFARSSALDCERYLVSEHEPPIVARIKNERLLFDARTLLSDDEALEVAQGVASYFSRLDEKER